MPVRKVVADEKIKEDVNEIAFQNHYIACAEWPEVQLGNVLDFVVKEDTSSELNLILHYLKVHAVISKQRGCIQYYAPDNGLRERF